MSTTLGDLKTRTRRWVHQITPSTSMFDDNLLTNVINAAYLRRWTQLDLAHEGRFVQVATMSLVADQARYSWPANLIRVMKLEYVDEDGTQTPLQRDERHESSLQPDSWLSPPPYTYRPLSGGFILEPTPQDATGSLRVEYVAMPSALTGDVDAIHPDFPEVFSELIVLDAAVALIDSEGQLEDGSTKAVLRQREEWSRDWKDYINKLVTARTTIEMWNPHWMDS